MMNSYIERASSLTARLLYSASQRRARASGLRTSPRAPSVTLFPSYPEPAHFATRLRSPADDADFVRYAERTHCALPHTSLP